MSTSGGLGLMSPQDLIPALGQALARNTQGQFRFALATVLSNFAPASQTQIRFDLDQGTDAASGARSLYGPLWSGARVLCLISPPRNVTIIGVLFNQDIDGNSFDLYRLRLLATNDESLASTLHAFQIGPDTGANLAMDNNEIQARNNGAATSLFLNNDGGLLGIGTGAATGNVQIGPTATAHILINFNQIWALSNAAASILYLNFSSAAPVQIGDGSAGGAQIVAAAMSSQIFTTASSGGAITGTTYVSSNALGTTFTVPDSGRFLVAYASRANMTSTTDQRGFWTFQIQAGSSAGAVVHNPVDIECCEAPMLAGASANAGRFQMGRTVPVEATGLSGFTPGSTIFIVMCARLTGGTSTIQLAGAHISLIPMP